MGQLVQLIAPDGTATADSDYRLPPETLTWLYEHLVLTRDLDAEFVNLQRQGELALYASCRGQEAAQVGAAACLRKTDWLFPQFRELGVFLVRGIAPARSPRCGGAPGTADSISRRNAVRPSRFPSPLTPRTRWVRRWPPSVCARTA